MHLSTLRASTTGHVRKIFFVSHVSSSGGAERSLIDLLSVLDPQRFDALVALPSPGELSEALDELGVPWEACASLQRLHRVRHPARALIEAAALVRGAGELHRAAKRYGAELLHANSTTAALYACPATLRLRVPLIWHLRDLRKPGLVEDCIGRVAAKVVVPSEACGRRVLGSLPASSIEQISNGIRVDQPGSAEAHLQLGQLIEGEGPLAVTIGQPVAWKRHQLVVAAARLLRDQGIAARFLIVGDDRWGDLGAARSRLQQEIDRAGLGRSVRQIGYRADVAGILACADLLIHAAYPEPFGRVVVEAMAAGVPVVVCSGDHGPAETVRHEVDGLLVPPGDAAALARAVASLVADPETRSRLGASGRERARKRYDRRMMGRQMAQLYESLLPAGPDG